MEHESFENLRVAERLNRDFVSIKVDREERPDIDRVYMTFVQATTGSGGWPMSVWLTPALEPFYGGTYFPPESGWGRPGFIDVLVEIARAWKEERSRVVESAESILKRLRDMRKPGGNDDLPAPDVLDAAVRQFKEAFDAEQGGFGGAPKFPRPSELLFLLREHARTGAVAPLDMVITTLRSMAGGGLRDHLGGGFHRYSVDAAWRVPHFEKMLYDQAQLLMAYLEASQVTGDPWLADVVRDTIAYVRRDLTDSHGGFYSAEDADSVLLESGDESIQKKREGAFYVWSNQEVRRLLGADADAFSLRYGLLPEGNAPTDPQGEFTGLNLLYTARGIDDVASLVGDSPEDVEAALVRGRNVLLKRRESRPRPHLDDKVLTAWNGLMIGALARAGRVLENGTAELAMATRAAEFVRDRLWIDKPGTLLRRFRSGEAGVEGYAEDYAYLIFGLLELFQAGGDPRWLTWAIELQRRQDTLFWDRDDGGWFSTTGNDPSVLVRLKEDYDGAEPAAASMSAWNLFAITRLTGDQEMSDRLVNTLAASAVPLTKQGRGVPMMASALAAYHAPGMQIIIAGKFDSPDTLALRRAVEQRYLPFAVVLPVEPDARETLATVLPWTAALNLHTARPTAYVCQDFTCRLPVTSADDLARLLDGSGT